MEPGDASVSATEPVAWSGTADFLTHPPNDMATARMFVLALIAGLALWVLFTFLVI